MRSYLAAALSLILVAPFARAQNASQPSFKLEGNAALMTDYIEDGLSQSDQKPAVQSAFWFGWGPQFRVGASGSSVSYEHSDADVVIKLNAEIRVAFSALTDLQLFYSDNHYFAADNRNGNTLGAQLNVNGWGTRLAQQSNFFGSTDHANLLSENHVWPVFNTWKLDETLGYVMPISSTQYGNYFYLTSMLGTKVSAVYYQIGLNYNSSPSAFAGTGMLLLLLKAAVDF